MTLEHRHRVRKCRNADLGFTESLAAVLASHQLYNFFLPKPIE